MNISCIIIKFRHVNHLLVLCVGARVPSPVFVCAATESINYLLSEHAAISNKMYVGNLFCCRFCEINCGLLIPGAGDAPASFILGNMKRGPM